MTPPGTGVDADAGDHADAEAGAVAAERGRAVAEARSCLAALAERGETLATAESLTAGLICSTVAETPGASSVLRGGVVTYATHLKTTLLGVDEALLRAHGVFSLECAAAMAGGARGLLGVDWAVSCTGVAGPEPQDGCAAGSVYVGVAGPRRTRTRVLRLEGGRNAVRAQTVTAVLGLLVEELRC